MTTHPAPLRIGSLCTGYGGLDTAVQAVLGGRLAWVADPDPGAAAILAHHHPTVPNLGDITTVDWHQVLAEHGPVDVAEMGFPCQDVSVAGEGAGIAPGTRSGLWAHCARAIAVLRPRIVVIENVEGLLSRTADRGVGPDGTPLDEDAAGTDTLRAAGAVLGDLAGLGFDAEWQVVPASAVGAAHQRKRVFILAWPADAPGPGLEARREGRPGGDAVQDPHGAALGERRVAASGQAQGRGAWADARGRGGAPAAHASGDGRNEGRPEPARVIRGSDAAIGGGAAPAHTDDRPLSAEPDREPTEPQADHLHDQQHPARRVLDWGRYSDAVHRWEDVLGRPAPAPTEPGRTGQPRLSPAFVEWLMGLPAGYVTAVPGLTRNQQLRALGNGVVPQQGAAALRLLLARATAPRPAPALATP